VSDSPASTAGSSSSTAEGASLLSAETLLGIASLELRARAIAEGLLAGTHRSRRFGSSTEFAEHKVYTPGDDLRRLDWRAYARVDRYFVRRYEEETNLDVALVVDTSASMSYAGGARGTFGRSKLEVAKTLAAAVAWLAHSRSDATALSIFADDERLHLPPRARPDQLALILGELSSSQASGTTDVARSLAHVAERTSRRSLIVLLSDFLDTSVDALAGLGVLRKRGSDVVVLHVLDRDELDFPFDGVVRFEDLEGERHVQVDAPLVKKAYLEELRAFLTSVQDSCAKRDLRYTLAATDASPVLTLAAALEGTRLGGGRT
jgi:uncharacterized protein (DUF58 family)